MDCPLSEWGGKNYIMNSFLYTKEYKTSLEKIEELSKNIQNELASTKIPKKDINNVLLLLEEVAVELTNNDVTKTFKVVLEKKFGNWSLKIVCEGEEYNPLELIKSYDADDIEKSTRHILFSTYKDRLGYSHKGKNNCVYIRIYETGKKAIYYTFAAMIVGVIAGILLKNFAPEKATLFCTNYIFDIVQTLFIKVLKMVLAPLVFCSIAASISGLSDISKVGKIAARVMLIYFLTSIMSVFIGFGFGKVFFSGNLNITLAGGVEKAAQKVGAAETLKNTIVNVVPADIVSPVLNGEMLQVIFVAVIIGLCGNVLGDRVKIINDLIDAGNTICMKIVEVIMKFLPLTCFCSMASCVAGTGTKSLISLMKLVIAMYVGSVVLAVIYAILVAAFGKLNPLPFLKKVVPYMITPFIVQSSSACVPMTIDVCRNKLGVEDRVSSFSIPLGATINMNGTCLYQVIAVMMFMKACSIPLTVTNMFVITITIILLALGAPGVPGSTLLCLSTLFSTVGIPGTAITLIMGVNQFNDMICTSVNVMGDIAATVIVASGEKEINTEVYNA